MPFVFIIWFTSLKINFSSAIWLLQEKVDIGKAEQRLDCFPLFAGFQENELVLKHSEDEQYVLAIIMNSRIKCIHCDSTAVIILSEVQFSLFLAGKVWPLFSWLNRRWYTCCLIHHVISCSSHILPDRPGIGNHLFC